MYSPDCEQRKKEMRIEAVIVCVNYSDFLAHTLPDNLQHLDGVVVVTTPEDKETQRLCTKYSVDFIETRVFYEDGAPFNKARGINLGLAHLKHSGWLLHMDADTLLPHRFRTMLDNAKLEQSNIYGADRLNVRCYEDWAEHKHKIVPQHQSRYLVNPPKEFSLGCRLLHMEYGYCPIGYFQLWHSSLNRKYPINSGSSEHSDVLFAVQWPRRNRILLPELFVFHLESEPGPMGQNWKGRKSKPFKPQGG